MSNMLRKQVREIVRGKAHLRTTSKKSITKHELIEESRVLLNSTEFEVLSLRYLGLKINSYVKVSMDSCLSESSVKRIEAKAIDKLARVKNDEYPNSKYIRSSEVFMLYSDEIMEAIEKVEKQWKEMDIVQRKEKIRLHIEGTQQEDKREEEKWWYEENLRLLDSLEDEKLNYFLEVHHRSIMLHAEQTILNVQFKKEGIEELTDKKKWKLEVGASKEYEDCTFEEKYNRQYGLAKYEFIQDGEDDFTDIEELELYCYDGEPMDIMIKLKTLEGEALEVYLNSLPPIDLVDEMIDDGMTPAERALNTTMESICNALEEADEENIKAKELGLKGDYKGTGFGKNYSDCTLAEQTKRQLNFYNDMLSVNELGLGFNMDSMEQGYKEIYGLTFKDIITKLTMLQGEKLEEFISTLPPIGENMGFLEE